MDRRRAAVAGAVVIGLSLAACSGSATTPRPSASPHPAGSASAAARPADPREFGATIPEGALLLNSSGKGNGSLSVPVKGTADDLLLGVSCLGKGGLKVRDESGRLLIGIATCDTRPDTVYDSRAPLRAADGKLTVETTGGAAWRLAVHQAPHA